MHYSVLELLSCNGTCVFISIASARQVMHYYLGWVVNSTVFSRLVLCLLHYFLNVSHYVFASPFIASQLNNISLTVGNSILPICYLYDVLYLVAPTFMLSITVSPIHVLLFLPFSYKWKFSHCDCKWMSSWLLSQGSDWLWTNLQGQFQASLKPTNLHPGNHHLRVWKSTLEHLIFI